MTHLLHQPFVAWKLSPKRMINMKINSKSFENIKLSQNMLNKLNIVSVAYKASYVT